MYDRCKRQNEDKWQLHSEKLVKAPKIEAAETSILLESAFKALFT